MKVSNTIFVGLFILSFIMIESAQAQLINYERRQRLLGTGPATPTQTATTAKAVGGQAVKSGPAWMTTAPTVRNRAERRFDRNRDGKLSIEEVKSYLSSVVTYVERRGQFTIDSRILNDYDLNNDGVITRYELRNIRDDIR